MNNNLDKVAIILQGTSVDKKQMNTLYEYYNSLGFNNIIISSYSDYIPDHLINEKFVINNDNLLDKHFIEDANRFGSNTNYQILTTKIGIDCVFINYPNVKYIMKHRADHRIDDLNEWVITWIDRIKTKKRIISLGRNTQKENFKWYIADYWNFGLKEDMKILWNIPLIESEKAVYRRGEEYISSAFLKLDDNGKWDANKEIKGNIYDYYTFCPDVARCNWNYKINTFMTISDCLEEENNR